VRQLASDDDADVEDIVAEQVDPVRELAGW
jgi:hypothetical protein